MTENANDIGSIVGAGQDPAELDGAISRLERLVPREMTLRYIKGEDPSFPVPSGLSGVEDHRAWNTIVAAKLSRPPASPKEPPAPYVPDPTKENVTMEALLERGAVAIDAFAKAHPEHYRVLVDRHNARMSRPGGLLG